MSNKPTPLIIAFIGAAGAGKDSAATALVNHQAFISIALADSLRREVVAAWQINEGMLTHRATKEWPIDALKVGMCGDMEFVSWCVERGHSLHEPRSARWVMQTWGDYKRRHQPDYYAAVAARWIMRNWGVGFRRFAVTDMRFPIEAQALHQIGALYAVEVVSHTHAHGAELQGDTCLHHNNHMQPLRETLGRLNVPVHTITNDGTLEGLADQVLALPCVPAGAERSEEC
ncbi:hypothetical protein P3G55_24000 [Leptospira sp. 96542]|nr:hypothetical protein [Leptospira sp. 96542]